MPELTKDVLTTQSVHTDTPLGSKKPKKDDPGTEGPDIPEVDEGAGIHPESVTKRISGNSDIALNTKGVEMAAALGERLAAKGGLNLLYSSPLKRAVQTADAIVRAFNEDADWAQMQVNALCPWHLGQLEGESSEEAYEAVSVLLAHPEAVAAGNGADGKAAESFSESRDRQLEFFEQIAADAMNDPELKIGLIMHSRGMELLTAWVQCGYGPIDTPLLTQPSEDPIHADVMLWKGNEIHPVDLLSDAPLLPGVYLIMHSLTDDDTDKGNTDLTKSDLFDHNELSKVEKAGNGVMLAFWPPPALASALAEVGGEPADQLHITLAYFGKIADLGVDKLPAIEQAVQEFAATHGPVTVNLAGLGRFPATPNSDGKDVIYVGVNSQGLKDFRNEMCVMVEAAGGEYKKNFDWTPHMTLMYVDPNEAPTLKVPAYQEVTFDRITLSLGGDKKEYILAGEPARFELQGDIIKVDNEQRRVFGWFSIVAVNGRVLEDTQEDIIQEETIEEAAYGFVLDFRVGGVMHRKDANEAPFAIGRLIESCVFTPEKVKAMVDSLHEQGIPAVIDLHCVPWWGGMQVDNEIAWEMVKTGKLRAWSIGGTGKRDKLGKSK